MEFVSLKSGGNWEAEKENLHRQAEKAFQYGTDTTLAR